MDQILLIGKKKVTAQSVIYMKAESNYSDVYLADGQVVTLSKTLKKLQEQFEPYGFFRSHKSFLINPQHVVSSWIYEERPAILLSNNHQVDISRRRKNDFLQIRRKFMA
jgi:two-component system LytT family response regulator